MSFSEGDSWNQFIELSTARGHFNLEMDFDHGMPIPVK